jgi:hypothetical protein
MLLDYFFRRQTIDLFSTTEDTLVYTAQISLLNHIRVNYTEDIPTIDILYSKIEDEAKKVNSAIPALYALYTASDVYKAKDHNHEFPLVVLTDSKHMDKDSHYASGIGLASRLSQWLLAHQLFNDANTTRVYEIKSPVHIEPYSITERYMIALLLIKLEDRSIT